MVESLASVLERRKSEASVLRDFEETGELVICISSKTTLPLWHALKEMASSMPWRSTHMVSAQIVDASDEVGISKQDRIIGISQGWKLTGGVKTAERKLADGSFRHGG